MNITRKIAVSLLVGLTAGVAIGLNASGEGLDHVARTAQVAPVGCNTQTGYPAEGLFIWDPH
jgi:hypothetical protein